VTDVWATDCNPNPTKPNITHMSVDQMWHGLKDGPAQEVITISN